TSERSGWKHLYHYDKTGTLLTQVTDGPWEFRNLVRLGIVSPAGGEPAFVDLADYTRGDFLISSTGWWPDASRLSFTIQNRTQTWLDLCTVSPRGGTPTRLLRDATEAWIEAPSLFRVLRDGSFLLTSERSGWKHLYHYDKTGTLLTQVTDGPWEFRSLVRLDEDRSEIFFTCTADSPLATTLYAVNLDGSDLRQLTPNRGTHRTTISPGGAYIVDSWSTAHTPDRTLLRDRNGKILRTLDTNPVFDLDTWERGTLELLRIPASRTTDDDPIMLEAMFIYPPDFDPDRRYPVWFSTYAGPHAPTVRDSWAGGRAHDHMLTTSGFLVFRADPYSASGKGARSAWTAYKRLGVPEMEDINDLMEWLKAQPFVDPDRIGMSGFSYGGFITAYAMTHSTHFARGIAGGSVTDWRDYDTIYTERYMQTPQDNPEGYAATSVVAAAKNLHGTLLLTHGWM
ncbi:Dipeptidyl peptidase IV, partial [hydrothermal vent metagenome]